MDHFTSCLWLLASFSHHIPYFYFCMLDVDTKSCVKLWKCESNGHVVFLQKRSCILRNNSSFSTRFIELWWTTTGKHFAQQFFGIYDCRTRTCHPQFTRSAGWFWKVLKCEFSLSVFRICLNTIDPTVEAS